MDARYHDDRYEGPPEDACINDGRRSSGWGTGTTMMARTMPDSSGPTMVRRHRDHRCGMMDTMATGEESVAATQHDHPATFPFPLTLSSSSSSSSTRPASLAIPIPAVRHQPERRRRSGDDNDGHFRGLLNTIKCYFNVIYYSKSN